jgi:hypothetical protein
MEYAETLDGFSIKNKNDTYNILNRSCNNINLPNRSCSDKNLPCNDAFTQYVGYTGGLSDIIVNEYFTPRTVAYISAKVSGLLKGILPDGRNIVIADKVICSVMSNIYENSMPSRVGDIYSRYNIPSGETEGYISNLVSQCIQAISSDTRNYLEMEEQNKKLSIWDTVLGDFNQHGLRAHAPIKIREKNTNHRGMVGFMNY